MMWFADDLDICRAKVELQLERWRETFTSPWTKGKQRKIRVHAMTRKIPNYLHSGNISEHSENVHVLELIFRCQRRKTVNNKVTIALSKWRETILG